MKFKGSYTVEAAVIISISFIIFGMAMAIAYELFKTTIEYVGQGGAEVNTVSLFRFREALMGVYNSLKD